MALLTYRLDGKVPKPPIARPLNPGYEANMAGWSFSWTLWSIPGHTYLRVVLPAKAVRQGEILTAGGAPVDPVDEHAAQNLAHEQVRQLLEELRLKPREP